MEIDITRFFNEEDAGEFSASAMELGANAGRITWNNAKRQAADEPLLTTEEELEEARDYFGEFGAWDDEERAAWDADDINALLIQYISGNIRELEDLCMGADGTIRWDVAERMSNAGRISGDIYPGDDGRIYFYMGL